MEQRNRAEQRRLALLLGQHRNGLAHPIEEPGEDVDLERLEDELAP